MTRVPGPSLDQLDRLGDDYASLVAGSLATAARQLDVNVGAVEDLGVIRFDWAISVETILLPALGVAFEVGAATIRVGLREATGLTASGATLPDEGGAGLPGMTWQNHAPPARGMQGSLHRAARTLTAAAFTDVPPTSDALAEQYLAQARNRLVGVGDELWGHAREELLEGLRAGESVPELAARVRKVAPEAPARTP